MGCGHFRLFGTTSTCEGCGVSLNRFKVYTGPTLVGNVAHRLRQAGFDVLIEGTEHVYVAKFDATQADVLQVLPTWRFNDVQEY